MEALQLWTGRIVLLVLAFVLVIAVVTFFVNLVVVLVYLAKGYRALVTYRWLHIGVDLEARGDDSTQVSIDWGWFVNNETKLNAQLGESYPSGDRVFYSFQFLKFSTSWLGWGEGWDRQNRPNQL